MAIAIFPGSFNPFTIGHLDILARGLRIFDKVYVSIGYNESKGECEDGESAASRLRHLLAGCPRVEVSCYSGLTVDEARRVGASVILRGVRNAADMEYERSLADVNWRIAGIDTMILPCRPELGMVSSSMVRELMHFGYDVSEFMPTEEDVRKVLCEQR